jgi:hypothetical protein
VFHIQSDDEEINKCFKERRKLKEDFFPFGCRDEKEDDDMKIVNETKVGEAQIWAGIK